MGDHQDCARVCRVLAAQLREAQVRFERSSGTLLATLDHLEAQVAGEDADAAAAAVQTTLDTLLFAQAQEHDLIRQMMSVVAHALALLPKNIDVDGLENLYVTDAQRMIHSAVLRAGPAAAMPAGQGSAALDAADAA